MTGGAPHERTGRLALPWAAAAAAAFAVLVTANSGGYRYGVSDQAYYVPALLAKLTPGLFPQDSAMLESQGRFSIFDDVLASAARVAAVDLPVLFLLGYLVTVALFAAAALASGAILYRSRWSTLALLAALALRHQVLGTGVNSFEGYFHPRVLAFSVGFLAIVEVLRVRPLAACALAAVSMAVHPTTGAWFGLWVAVALVVNAERRAATAAIAVLALAGAAATVGALALRGSFVVMDAAWLEAIGSKRYLFPNTWRAGTWAVNAIAPAVVAVVFAWRRRTGRALPAEGGVVAGCLALVAAFVVSLPCVAHHVALAVQLQTSRMFWHVELLATLYLVWLAVDVPLATGSALAARLARALVVVLVLAGAARGFYILRVQFDRPLVRVGLVADDWQAMAAWARHHTPAGARFLVDPQHVGRYGVSFRVAASRDVFLETVKDSAMATYSRDVALGVVERQKALPSFDGLTATEALALARGHDLQVMITERGLPLPELHRHGRFVAYGLSGRQEPNERGIP
jgi:hypothetical protein